MRGIIDSPAALAFIKRSIDPAQFYFTIVADVAELDGDGGSYFNITPVEYFKNEGCAYDQHLYDLLEDYLPEDCEEMCESSFYTDTDAQELIKLLKSAGFQQNVDFDRL